MTFPAIAELVPHGPPMVLLDEVIRWEEKGATCSVRVRGDAPFVEGGRVRAIVALEYMAQSVAVYTALRARAREEPMKMGYLVGARSMRLETGFFAVGDELVVDVHEEFDGEELGSFACSVQLAGETVATAKLSVYRGRRTGD